MDKAIITMIDNLEKNTGKSFEYWIDLVKSQNFSKHGEAMKFLKETHGFTHGYANLVVLKSKGSDAESVDDKDSLIAQQYKGKEHLMPFYQKLINEIQKFGNDIEILPKNAYVSLKRKKQFATLMPASKTRFEIGINLKGQDPQGKLEAEKPNAMCSHKVKLTEFDEIDAEVLAWLQKAYDNAG
jgi:predicted transport protein